MFETKVVQKFKTHVLCSNFFFSKILVYEIKWKKVVEWGRPNGGCALHAG